MTSDPEIDKLTAAVADYPDIVELRLRLIRLLVQRGRPADAMVQAGEALRREPDNAEVRAAVAQVSAAVGNPAPAPDTDGFDWRRAESDMQEIVAPE